MWSRSVGLKIFTIYKIEKNNLFLFQMFSKRVQNLNSSALSSWKPMIIFLNIKT